MTNHEKGRGSNVHDLATGKPGAGGEAAAGTQVVAQADASAPQEAPPETGDFRFTYDNVIRELRILELEIGQYKNVVSLGSARAIRMKCIDKACSVMERVRDEDRRRKSR